MTMLQASGRSYVCWRCASRGLASPQSSPWSQKALPTGSICRSTQLTSPPFTRALATVSNKKNGHDAPGGSFFSEKEQFVPIRERLRRWEEENPTKGEAMLSDLASHGSLSNSYTRPMNMSTMPFDPDDTSPLFAGDELADLRSEDAMLNPGDLIELASEGSRRPVVAICLGRFHGYEHFYSVSGKWFSSLGTRTLFVVNNFATADELQPIIDSIPTTAIPIEELNTLQELGEGPSQSAAAGLLRKMLEFIQNAEAVYQANAGTLDASSSFIGDPIQHRYLTLHEITELLLPNTDKHGGKFSPQSLYAVHRALMQDEVFFRPVQQKGHQRSYLFEISPLSEVRIIQSVDRIVKQYLNMDGDVRSAMSKNGSPVASFVTHAQKLIDASRKTRQWSDTGIIGPSTTTAQEKPEWSNTDLELLQFIELWVSYQKFPKYSRLQSLGSVLLRAVDRYQEAQGYTPATGWTFLQEVGFIPPWEIQARYNVRFPGVKIERGGGFVRPFMGMLDRHLKKDILSSIRTPLSKVTTYCIDDISAREIDDAVSLERTSNPQEHWIHVHVADPASSFGADTPIAKYAELIPEAIYLPGHLEPMLPESLIHDRFSLGPDRPCLTFSALVTTDGVILDEKITANTLKNVIYMTYEDAAIAIGESQDGTDTESSAPNVQPANRKMTGPGDLTEHQKSDLVILAQLGKAMQAGRLEKGATPFFAPRPTATVNFDVVKQKESGGYITTSGDPLIQVHYSQRSGTDLVENAMKLANEIAARWCFERGIPIPYRTQPSASRNMAFLQQYARDVVNPMLTGGARQDDKVWRQFRALMGRDEVSTTPGPHFILGSDMYTKATSPLRRFGDLIVHWQIERALLEENTLKRKLIGPNNGKHEADDLSFLPFSRDRLDRMLPMLRLREKQARTLTNIDGTDQWILQAMARAWQFGDGLLPDTFKLTVQHLARSAILGPIDWFERRAMLKNTALNGVISKRDVRIGDVIEVRLTDINVYSRQICVEAVSVVEKVSRDSPPTENAPLLLDSSEVQDTLSIETS